MQRYLKICLYNGLRLGFMLILLLASSTFAQRPEYKNRAEIKPSSCACSHQKNSSLKLSWWQRASWQHV